MKFLSIDRFDGDYAICQDDEENMYSIKIQELPKDAKIGDILSLLPKKMLILDRSETEIRKKRIKKLQDKLFEV